MLSGQEIGSNKLEYINAIKSINREFDKNALLNMLDETDFYSAPASVKYHSAYPGGLCEHSLNVWKTMLKLNEIMNLGLDIDSISIVSLCHDYAKINFYIIENKNKKVYSDNGSKSDSMGRYDWVTVQGYSIRDPKDRFIYGNHESTCEAIVRNYIPLSYEESSAILHHHGAMSSDSAQDNIGEIFTYNKLALILHLADMLASFIVENRE